MGIKMFPIIGRIEFKKFQKFKSLLKKIEPEDELISYISSGGGEIKYMSLFTGTIGNLPINTTAFAGKRVSSSAVTIFCSFDRRVCFKDSEFLIHESSPRKGKIRDEEFEIFDMLVFTYISERAKKIKSEEVLKMAKKGKYISATKALKMGLVDEIIPMEANFENFNSLYKTAEFQ